MNITETILMIISKNQIVLIAVTIDENKYKPLDKTIEIKTRIEIVRQNIISIKNVSCNSFLNLNCRKKKSQMLHLVNIVIIIINKIETCEMRLNRGILKIPWIPHIRKRESVTQDEV